MSSNETKIINKSDDREEQQTRKNSSSLKRGVAMAGAMMSGSVVGAAGMEEYHRIHKDDVTDNTEEITLEVTSTEEVQHQNSGTTQTPVQSASQGQGVQEVEIHVEEPDINEPVLPASDMHGTETEEGEIIAEELVDSNDNDVPDFVEEVIGVEQVYTLDGSEATAAAIHNSLDGDMYLVDVDNDGDFDVILDANGNEMAIGVDDFGNPIMSSEYLGEGGTGDQMLTLSDLELANGAIDPLNDMDIANNTIGDDIQQDIIDTSSMA